MTYWGQVYPMVQDTMGAGITVGDFFSTIVPKRIPSGQFFYTRDPPWQRCGGAPWRMVFQFKAQIVATAHLLQTHQDYAAQPGFSGWLQLDCATITLLANPISQADFTAQFGFSLSNLRHLLSDHESWFDKRLNS